jgi:hypothetical protein
MTPARAADQEIRKAKSWAQCCATRVLNAERALQAACFAQDGPGVSAAVASLKSARHQLAVATEDVTGWRRLARTLK